VETKGTAQVVKVAGFGAGAGLCQAKRDDSVWDSFWHGITPADEIQMWDFYGGRPWIMKHTPRYGKVLEAGCGLGRYVLYLSLLSIDIEGLDFHEPTVGKVHQWAVERALPSKFRVGDVTCLPYGTESLSGYLSFGVIEHFAEGPAAVLAEAYRVLRPGGVAVISTPSLSFAQLYYRVRRWTADAVKKLCGCQLVSRPFFQYWYTPRQLRAFVQACGLKVVLYGACDLRYAAWELVGARGDSGFVFRAADFLERTAVARLGGQAFVVAVKVADAMYCFLCGEKKVLSGQWRTHYLPICDDCSGSSLAGHYVRKRAPSFHGRQQYNPPPLLESAEGGPCHFCGRLVRPDAVFEDFGFYVPICRECLAVKAQNLAASNEFLQPRWRPRRMRLVC
jgi:SAM-dependent methyltransferase